MSPVVKLSPAAIAVLLNGKRKAVPPDPPLFDDLTDTTDGSEPPQRGTPTPTQAPAPQGSGLSLAEILRATASAQDASPFHVGLLPPRPMPTAPQSFRFPGAPLPDRSTGAAVDRQGDSDHPTFGAVDENAAQNDGSWAPLNTPDPRDFDPRYTSVVVAPRHGWSDQVRSQYTGQLNRLYDAHRYDDGPTAEQIQAVRNWGAKLAAWEAVRPGYLVLGKSPEIYPEDSPYNPSYDSKKYTAFDGDYLHEDVPGSEVSPQSDVRPTSHPTPRFLLNAALAGRGPARQATLGELSAELDQFGPEEFSKRVTQYGTWLGSHPHGLGASTATARRTYDFLQDRLSFWLGYQPVSPEAHANLLSASSILYQGGQTAQIVGVDEMSPSTQQAAVASMAFEGPNLRLGGKSAPTRESIEGFPEFYAGSLGKFKGLGGFLDRNEVGIIWGRGIRNQGLKDQGGPWEDFLEKQMPPRSRLHQFSKTWDLKGETSGTAISAKTLDTSSYWYAKNPANVYYTLARYIREAAEYDNGPKPKKINIDRSEISARQIQLAVPLYTSQAQWQQIKRAIKYGRDRGISVIVSKVR